jgi:uncharacterized protein (UPF0210 family)
MKIRSITYFDNLKWPLDDSQLQKANKFITTAREIYQRAGYEVQTTRLATTPFPQVLGTLTSKEAVNYAQELERNLIPAGFDYISIGPAIPDYPKSYSHLPEILESTQNIFTAGIISSARDGIVFPAIKKCAAVITKAAGITPDGFTNLRFAALANVPPGSPFLPAAYHDGNENPGFAIATEAADLAVEAVGQAATLEDARQELVKKIEIQAAGLSQPGFNLEKQDGVKFLGLDFSLAPYPQIEKSIGTAIEGLGVPALGEPGSLAAVAVLAEALEQAQYQKIGFNGVMLPVLEDAVLAKRIFEGRLGISDLLLYSTVCGTGLDTIPLPGNVSAAQLYAVLVDLAALAQRLGKPLTARFMPIPGKAKDDLTEFEFEYFANSKVMDLQSQPLTGLMRGDEDYQLTSRSDLQGRTETFE